MSEKFSAIGFLFGTDTSFFISSGLLDERRRAKCWRYSCLRLGFGREALVFRCMEFSKW